MVWLLRGFFYLLYHPFAVMYDWVSAFVSTGMWQSWVRVSLQYLSGPRVLELGHGPGHLQALLCSHGFDAYGLDESAQMGRVAKRTAWRSGQPGEPARLVRALAQAIPFPNGSFENVVATFPTRYIFEDLTVGEVSRVLKPGGRLVIVLSGWVTGKKLTHRLAAFLFKITGEAPAYNPSWQTPLDRRGFQVEVQQVTLPDSQVLVIVAQKRV